MANPADTAYRLVFADEFNGTSVDASKWVVATPSWTMPNSASTASASQVSVGNGVLTLNATRPGTAASFSSGSISSYGKYTFVGGYVEARINLPSTVGSWPAFWGLYNGWPPEADIMEYPLTTDGGTSGFPNTAYNTNFHYSDTSGNAAAGAGRVNTSQNLNSTGYHIFAMDWTVGTAVKFYLDGTQVSSYTGTAVAQMVNMYMILDYAVGGWPGTPSTTQWPVGWSDQTVVDYVRVWQKNSNGDTTSTWNINGGGTFTTTGNWSNGIVPKYGNQTAVFGTVGAATTASITMPTWTVFGGLTFSGTPAYTVGSSSTSIQLAGQPLGSSTTGATVLASSTSTANQNINANVELWSNTTLENDMTGGQVLNLNGVVSGSGVLNVTGAGTAALTATNNPYTGATNIGTNQEAAVLRVSGNNALGSTATTVIGPGGNATTARLELAGGNTQTGSIDFRGRNTNSVGIESISGLNTLAGTISASAGGGLYAIQSDADTFMLSGTLQAASGARAITLQGAGGGIVNGVVQNGGGTVSLLKAGTGTWTLAGADTYTGTTTVNAGTLRLAPAPVAAYSFDNVSGSTVINGGSGGAVMNGTLTNGATVVSGGRFGNAVSLSGGAYVNINSPVVDLGNTGGWTVSAWVKTTTAGSTLLTKGSGTSWSSGNTIFYLGDGSGGGSGGIPSSVRYAGGFCQGATTATAVNDGAWHMVTTSAVAGPARSTWTGFRRPWPRATAVFPTPMSARSCAWGSRPMPSPATAPSTTMVCWTRCSSTARRFPPRRLPLFTRARWGPVPSRPRASIAVASAGTFDVYGVTQTVGTLTGTGTLTKTGTGTLTLGNASAFTGGTSLGGGALVVNGSLSGGGNGTLTTAAGTVLTGSGTVSAVTTINGIHQPGASPGTQNFGAMTYGSTARLAWELTANSAASGFDQVAATGTVTITNGAAVDVYLNGTGSAVDLSNTFWTQAHSWSMVTAGGISGGAFALGNVSADPSGRLVSNYGTLALQQSGTTVSLVFTPYTVQQKWQRQYFGANWNNSSVAGNLANPAGDGVANLLKYALGMDPTVSNAVPWVSGTPGLPVSTVAAVSGQNYLALQVRRPIGLTGITYGAQVSSDLVAWSSGVQEGSATANGDGTEMVIFRDTVPIGQGDRRFIRLMVSQ